MHYLQRLERQKNPSSLGDWRREEVGAVRKGSLGRCRPRTSSLLQAHASEPHAALQTAPLGCLSSKPCARAACRPNGPRGFVI